MNDSIDVYINKSKKNLNTIIENLESNIEFLDNDLWSTYDEIKEHIGKIIDIYYDKYYLYTENDFSKISKYINFSNKINRRLKIILMAIIDYYESINEQNNITEKEGTILYLTILIYISQIIYDKKITEVETPKKIEKIINNIIDNFQKIRFKREKDLVTLISNIKNLVIENNKFNDHIDSLSTKESHNMFISINKDNNFYKVIYEYKIKELDDYEEKDINIVYEKMKIRDILTNISYDLCYFTQFKLLRNGIDYILLFPISKKVLTNKSFLENIKLKNKIINDKIKFLVNYEEIKDDYEFVNLMKEFEVDIYIEVNKPIETNNYNMFMDNKNIIVTEEFISINEKYVEIWKDMDMNFIIKNLENRLTEEELIGRK